MYPKVLTALQKVSEKNTSMMSNFQASVVCLSYACFAILLWEVVRDYHKYQSQGFMEGPDEIVVYLDIFTPLYLAIILI